MASRGYLVYILLLLKYATTDPVRIIRKVGEELKLECPLVTHINITSQLYWYRDEKPIIWLKKKDKWIIELQNDMEIDPTNFSLLLHSLGVQDSGVYRCEAILNNNTSLTSQHYDLIVQDVPSKPPVPPIVTAIDAYAISVTWQPSLRDNNSPITGYIVQLKTKEQWTNKIQVGNVNLSMIDNLWPFTVYAARIVAINEIGESLPSSPSLPVRTHEAAPTGTVESLLSESINSTAIHVQWMRPAEEVIRGVLRGYILQHEPADGGQPLARTVMDQNLTSWNFTKLRAYTAYIIKIRIFNNAGDGPDAMSIQWTDEGVPSKPRITNIPNRTHNSLKVEWERPTHINGKLVGYTIYLTDDNNTKEFTMLSSKRESMKTYVITKLKPYTAYKIQVSAFTSKGHSEKSDVFPGLTDVRGPGVPGNVNISSNSSSTMWIEWTRPSVFLKLVNLYYIRYRPRGQAFIERRFIPTDINRKAFMEYIDGLQSNQEYEVQIAGATKSVFYNKYFTGEFSVPIFVHMLGGSSVKEKQAGTAIMTAGMIAGIICTCVLIALVAGVIVFMRKYHSASYLYIGDRDGQNNVPPPTLLPDVYVGTHVQQVYDIDDKSSISVLDFSKHVAALHADSDHGFAREYDEIKQNTRTDLTSYFSTEPDNKHKNRYSDIKAYDHSRVGLLPLPGTRNSDYINANFVDGYQKQRAYIATQGPLPSTFADFWRMVWEHNSAVIVMITNLTERGRRKCDQYWPNEGEALYGPLAVKILNTSVMAHYTIRVFTLKHTKMKKKAASERLIYQYHYTNWPDHGVPDFTLPVLSYVRKSVAMSPENGGPIVVHCSAGVGRTGTYIVLDSMMAQIQDKLTVNVYAFLTHIRQQRNYLVQTEDQYIFIHDALLEYIESGETEVSAAQLTQYLQDLTLTNGPGSLPKLEKLFKLITAYTTHDYEFESALKHFNMSKNRVGGTLPVELSRVPLPAKPGEEGTDYINASYLNGYHRGREYIVTQHPLEKTTQDFWRMVWDQNSMIVVLLSQVQNDFVQFWPGKDETMDCGNFKVSFSEETHKLNYTTKYFLLRSTQDDYEYVTRFISSSYWPESCTPLSTVFELINTVKSCHAENDEYEGPIIVVDAYGGSEAGTFCALSTLFEQLHQEGAVDVYMIAKLYHMKRPNIFRSEMDYHFLYKAIESMSEEALREKQNSVASYSQQNHLPAARHTANTKSLTQPSTPSRLGSTSHSPQHNPSPLTLNSEEVEDSASTYLTPANTTSPPQPANGRIPSPGNLSPKNVTPTHNCLSSSPEHDISPQTAVTLEQNSECLPDENAMESLLEDSCVAIADRSSDNLLHHGSGLQQETVM